MLLLGGLALSRANPYKDRERRADSGERQNDVAVGGLGLSVADHQGRVQIKVFRGPTEHDGDQHFTPWGYWVKQPADDH